MLGIATGVLDLLSAPSPDMPKVWFRRDDVEKYWQDLLFSIYKVTDFLLPTDTFPNQTWHKTWLQRQAEKIPTSVGEILDAVQTALKLTEPNVFGDFVKVKSRFPLLGWKDSVEMAYAAQYVASTPDPAYDFKFNDSSDLVLWEEINTLAEFLRLRYTFNMLAQKLKPWSREEYKEHLAAELGFAFFPSVLQHVVVVRLEKIHEAYDSLMKQVLSTVKEESLNKDNFPARYASNISYNQLPYQRFRHEAVCRIDNFYLFIDELSDYKETYTYPYQMQSTLTSNYYYRTGGMVQNIHLKASLCYLHRRSFDYFIRLGNLMRPLRFVVSHDEQTRYILILNISAEHKFQMAQTIFENPKPAVSTFSIHAAVFGTPLPGFKAEDYGGDTTVLGVTEKKPEVKPLLDLSKMKVKPGA